MPNKISIKMLVEYDNEYLSDGDSLREQFSWIKDLVANSDLFADATITCLSIERNGNRVLD